MRTQIGACRAVGARARCGGGLARVASGEGIGVGAGHGRRARGAPDSVRKPPNSSSNRPCADAGVRRDVAPRHSTRGSKNAALPTAPPSRQLQLSLRPAARAAERRPAKLRTARRVPRSPGVSRNRDQAVRQGREWRVSGARPAGSEIAPPDVDVADRDRHQHHREGIERVGHEAERHAVALADAGDRQVGRGADQRAVAAEAGAERQAPPQRLDLVRRRRRPAPCS